MKMAGRRWVVLQGESSTARKPVWSVPRKRPAPSFCFCKRAPLNIVDLDVAGLTKLPENSPVLAARVSLKPLVMQRVTLLFIFNVTELLTDETRSPAPEVTRRLQVLFETLSAGVPSGGTAYSEP